MREVADQTRLALIPYYRPPRDETEAIAIVLNPRTSFRASIAATKHKRVCDLERHTARWEIHGGSRGRVGEVGNWREHSVRIIAIHRDGSQTVEWYT